MAQRMWIEVRDSKESWQRLLSHYLCGKRRKPRDGEGQAEPVTPPVPKPLSGGAAAPLDFDD